MIKMGSHHHPHQHHHHHGSGSGSSSSGIADSNPSLALPSFTDGDPNYNDGDLSSVADSESMSMASSALSVNHNHHTPGGGGGGTPGTPGGGNNASSSAAGGGGGGGGGGASPGGFSSKSARFKSAMTARARQRRVRRMRERGEGTPGAGSTGTAPATPVTPATPGSVESSAGAASTPGRGRPPPASSASAKSPSSSSESSSSSSPPSSPEGRASSKSSGRNQAAPPPPAAHDAPPPDRVKTAMEHVEQMKAYNRGAGRSAPGGDNGKAARPSLGDEGAPGSSALQNRMYEKAQRSRSESRGEDAREDGGGGGGNRSGKGGGGASHHLGHHGRSPSSPNLGGSGGGIGGDGNSNVNGNGNGGNDAISGSPRMGPHRQKSPAPPYGRAASEPDNSRYGAAPKSTTPQRSNSRGRNRDASANVGAGGGVGNHAGARPSYAAAAMEPPASYPDHQAFPGKFPGSFPPPAAGGGPFAAYHQQSGSFPPAPLPPPPPPPGNPPPPHVRQSASATSGSPSSHHHQHQQRRSRRDKQPARRETRPEDYVPDWSAHGSLSPDEVSDAKNFTSVQFACSTASGEVEMFSGDDTSAVDALERENSEAAMEAARGRIFGTRSMSFASGGGGGSRGASPAFGSGGGAFRAASPQSWQNEVWSESARRSSADNGSGVGVGGRGDVWSDATTPSLLQRGDIFHQKAAASIVSLLSPDRMSQAGLMAPEIVNSGEDDASMDVGGDNPAGDAAAGDDAAGKLKRMFTFDGDGDPGSSRGGEWRGMTQVNRALFSSRGGGDDLDDDVKQSVIFQAFRKNMMEPSPQMAELMSQIHRRPGTAIDRAFATRRKNACGALKILSAKEENRLKICWTVGVLPAVASVLSDVAEETPDHMSQEANTEARNRVVSTLLNLSVNKKNRMLIVNTPGVLEAMARTIEYDEGESRQGCCTALLYLAKTAEARLMIVKSAGMLEVLSKVIEVPRQDTGNAPTPAKLLRKRIFKDECAVPVSPLCSPGEGAAREGGDSTVGSESYHSDEDYSHDGSSCDSSEGSHSDDDSHSSGGSGTDKSGDDGDGDGDTIDEGDKIAENGVEKMEISFETAATEALTEQTLLTPGTGGAVDGAAKKRRGKSESKEDIYDADSNRFLHGARLSVFACLLCLVKSKENAFIIAREPIIVEALIGVSRRLSSPSHSRAMAILAHLTRHPKNCHQLVFKYVTLLTMLQKATASPDREARRYAFCALQNLSMDKSCRAPIAHSPKIVWSLTQICKERPSSTASEDDEDEARMAAVATLQNLADEPANLIQFTIVRDCIGTIIQIAREDVMRCERTDLTSFMAKNTLVTLSHWFRKIATSGSERVATGGIPAGIPPIVSPGGGSMAARGGLHYARLEPTIYDQWS